MSIKRLAELTHTSPGTVSKAFRESPEISEKTREEIFRVARREGWFDKYYKGEKKGKLVGILCPEPSSELYGAMAGRLAELLAEQGYDTVVGITAFDEERAERLFSQMVGRMQVDGVLSLSGVSRIKNPDRVPFVATGAAAEGCCAALVQGGIGDTIREAVRVLKEKGHRRVGFLGEERTGVKLALWQAAMRAEGLAVQEKYIVTVPRRFGEGGYLAMERILEGGELPTALFAAYDYMALGAMRCLRDRGLSVPEDLSLIGMDDISVDAYLDVPLTSVAGDNEAECRKMVEMLLADIARGGCSGRTVFVPGRLCQRGTVGAPKNEQNAKK